MKMNESKNDRLIKKIKALFSLAANNGATGNEADNALRMAEGLLKKHSIELFDLNDKDEVTMSFLDFNGQKWVSIVHNSIAKLYSCRCIMDNSWDKPKIVLVGTLSNLTTAKIVIQHLLGQIMKDTKGKGIAYKNGAAMGLGDTCEQIISERNVYEEAIPGTGLTVLDINKQNKNDIENWLNEFMPNLGKAKRTKFKTNNEGRVYGSGLNPGARVSGSGQKRLG